MSSAHPKIWKFIDLAKEMDNKMANDFGREVLEMVFYAQALKKKKLIKQQLNALVDRFIKGEVSLSDFLEKYCINKDISLYFEDLDVHQDFHSHSYSAPHLYDQNHIEQD